jgi:hypothetical protein
MPDKLTLTALAAHLGLSRPSTYLIVRSVGFPIPDQDKKWDRDAVFAWLDENRLPDGVGVVGGILVRSEPAA